MRVYRKKPVVEIDLKILLEDMGLTMDQFISVCIMCGCDYTNTVRGIGPVRALSLIRKHGDIETALASLDKKKYPVPDNFLYKEAAVLFKKPLGMYICPCHTLCGCACVCVEMDGLATCISVWVCM